jgi:phospholipid/cholesterol/gamma-HCH transport system permease protein
LERSTAGVGMTPPLEEFMVLATAPQLTVEPAGDILKLRPGGSWTAANVTTLEALSDTVTAQLDGSKT